MMRRKSRLVAVSLAALLAPVMALGQVPPGSVTTSPVNQAPAMGAPVLVLLAVVLAGVAVYRLRRAATVVALVTAVTLLAALGSAVIMMSNITISGADCVQRTTNPFDPITLTTLTSNCPTMIQIVDIQFDCGLGEIAPNAPTSAVPIPSCEVGQTLANGDVCRLPICV